MSLPGLLVVLSPLLVVAVGAVALTSPTARPDSTLASEVASARRHARVTSLLATVAMSVTVIVPVATAMVSDSALVPRAQACLPLAATAVALVVLLVGELTWPRPRGATRTAVLHDRSVATVLHRRWAAAAAAVTAVTTMVCVAGGLLGSADGRSISRTTAVSGESAGPFPGWAYTVPQLAALAVCVVLVVLVTRAALRRSTVISASVDVDRVLRQASTARALRAVVVGTLLTLGPDLVFGGLAAHNVVGDGLAAVLAWAAVALGLACVGTAAVACVLPVPRLTVPVPPAASRLSA